MGMSPDAIWQQATAHCPTIDPHQKLREILEKRILGRRTIDPIVLVGTRGSGRWHMTQLCHAYANASNSSKNRVLHRINPHALDFQTLENLLEAEPCSIYFEDFDQIANNLQDRLLSWIQQQQENPDIFVLLSTQEASHQLLTQLSNPFALIPLQQWGSSIENLAALFAGQALSELGRAEHRGLTRQAKSDIRLAVENCADANTHALRRAIRDSIFELGQALTSANSPAFVQASQVEDALVREFNFDRMAKPTEVSNIEQDFGGAWQASVADSIARTHHVSLKTLRQWVESTQAMLSEMTDQAPTYRNVVERTSKLNKVALWLSSEATTQAEFRRYFGERSGDMPTKSVAHQIFYEVFPKKEEPLLPSSNKSNQSSPLREELEAMFGNALPKVGSSR